MDVTAILALILATFTSFGQMAGVAALIAALVNALKQFGVVTDSTSGKWFAGFSLAASIGLVAVQVFDPALGVSIIDTNAGVFAMIIMLVLQYVASMGFGKLAHALFASMKLPVIGKSFTLR